jgi:hypothetical protein
LSHAVSPDNLVSWSGCWRQEYISLVRIYWAVHIQFPNISVGLVTPEEESTNIPQLTTDLWPHKLTIYWKYHKSKMLLTHLTFQMSFLSDTAHCRVSWPWGWLGAAAVPSITTKDESPIASLGKDHASKIYCYWLQGGLNSAPHSC